MPLDSERVPPSLRRKVAQRAQKLCEYCRCPEAFSPDSFTIDHIQPRQVGGPTASENLAWACFGCNGRKFTKTTHIVRLLAKQSLCLIRVNKAGTSILPGAKILLNL